MHAVQLYSSEVPQPAVLNQTSSDRYRPSDLAPDPTQPHRVYSVGSGSSSTLLLGALTLRFSAELPRQRHYGLKPIGYRRPTPASQSIH
jgi:hypothetical protein